MQHTPANLNSRTLSWTQRLVLMTAMGVLALAASSHLVLPGPGGVPISFAPFVVMMIGLTYSRWQIVATFASFLTLGALGAPVFSPLSAGLVGPTGGYLMAYGVAAYLMATLRHQWRFQSAASYFVLGVVGIMTLYTVGWCWLHHVWQVPVTFWTTIKAFVLFDVVKAAVAAQLASRMRGRWNT